MIETVQSYRGHCTQMRTVLNVNRVNNALMPLLDTEQDHSHKIHTSCHSRGNLLESILIECGSGRREPNRHAVSPSAAVAGPYDERIESIPTVDVPGTGIAGLLRYPDAARVEYRRSTAE